MKPEDRKSKEHSRKHGVEKPVSLSPLAFNEAVSDMLKVKPEPKKTKKSARKGKNRDS